MADARGAPIVTQSLSLFSVNMSTSPSTKKQTADLLLFPHQELLPLFCRSCLDRFKLCNQSLGNPMISVKYSKILLTSAFCVRSELTTVRLRDKTSRRNAVFSSVLQLRHRPTHGSSLLYFTGLIRSLI